MLIPGPSTTCDALRPRLRAERLADPAHELGVEGRRERRLRWGSRWPAGCPRCRACSPSSGLRRRPCGPSAIVIAGIPSRGTGGRVPEVGAQAQRRLLLQRQLPRAATGPPRERVRARDAGELHSARRAPRPSHRLAGAPSRHTTLQSIVIVRERPSCGTAHGSRRPLRRGHRQRQGRVPVSPAPARDQRTRRRRDLALRPCHRARLGRDDPGLVARGHRPRADQVAAQARDGAGRPTVRQARVGVDVGAVLVELLPQRARVVRAALCRSSGPTGCGSAPARRRCRRRRTGRRPPCRSRTG